MYEVVMIEDRQVYTTEGMEAAVWIFATYGYGAELWCPVPEPRVPELIHTFGATDPNFRLAHDKEYHHFWWMGDLGAMHKLDKEVLNYADY